MKSLRYTGRAWSLPWHPGRAGAYLYNCYLKLKTRNKKTPEPALLHVMSPCNMDSSPTNRLLFLHAGPKRVFWLRVSARAVGGPAAAVPGAGRQLPAGCWPVTPCLVAPRNPFVSSFLFPRLPCACVHWESEIMSPHCHFKCFLGLPSPSWHGFEKQYPCAVPSARSQDASGRSGSNALPRGTLSIQNFSSAFVF